MALSSNSDWASLPRNLLDSILDYLVPMEDYIRFSGVCMEDYIRFSGVCGEWRNAVFEKLRQLRTNHKRHCSLHQQVPLLMAPTTDNSRYRGLLYDVMKGKSLCEFPRPSLYHISGSSHGWLILVDKSYKVTLFNPLSEKHIHLPPIDKSIFKKHLGSMRIGTPGFPRRAVLSNDPDQNHNEFVLMMICNGLEGRLAFIKSGEEDWTYIRDMRYLEDIVYSNGLFYVLDGRGVLLSCDVSSDVEVKTIAQPVADQNDIIHNIYLVDHNTYLVESPEGDFLRVINIKTESIDARFVIHKLVWFSRNLRLNPSWIEVTSLGDVSLFLGDNHSTSVTASDFTGCRPNSIYICQSRLPFSLDGSDTRCVFSLDDRIATPLYPHSLPPRLWISPKFV
ncbi:hypothetical protein PVL29_020346 [Vitis rotundifolia]|uniref:KIB1-4 beta-propeller domain-containing protein n=1 Tax=Vitis rotundifolia TaxID=103349 RepID=A0AA39DF03_VITRO|nr:hypothetical protein PVL29_020346 [Vitis rotundifolia]